MKTKILVITSSFPKFKGDLNGGFVFDLLKNLSDFYDISVVSPWENKILRKEKMGNLNVYRHSQFFWNVKFAYGIGMVERVKNNKFYLLIIPFYILSQMILSIKIINKEKISIIHAHWIIPSALTAVFVKMFLNTFRKKNKIKIIATAWGSDLFAFNGFFGVYLKRFLLKRIDLMITQGTPLRDKAIEIGYSDEIHSIPSGVYTTIFKPEFDKSNYQKIFKNNNPNILFVGICVEAKGLSYLLEAINLLNKNSKNVNLLIIGDNSHAGKFKEYVDKSFIKKSVCFLGTLERDKIVNYFNTADIFILPSLSEGWPLSIMESMSSGLETIVTELPVFKDNLEYHNHLHLIPLRNSAAIYDKLNEIISKPIVKRIDNRDFAVNNFDWEIVAKKYSSLINTLVSNEIQ